VPARVWIASVVKSDEGKVNFSKYLSALTRGMRGQDTPQDPLIDFSVLHEQSLAKKGGRDRGYGWGDEGGWTKKFG
jgi:hypothetical protein